ncbi:MAG TPA: DUF5683 domain-containing protein [Candidatus Krumholzibacterium sp.]|nr:DUF5683 domain-containing protein [Candidatus Krumholzibacterium sp.]
MRRLILSLLLISLILPAASAQCAEAEDIIYSVLFPGLGQIRTGRYTRGTILVGAELICLGGLGVANIQYDRKIEAYDRAKILYDNSTYIGDAEVYYSQMVQAWDDADNIQKYRKVLAGAAIGVWVVGIADMAFGREAENPPVTMEIRQDGFIVCRSFSF